MSKRHVRRKAARVAAGGKPRWREEGRRVARELADLRATLPQAGQRFVLVAPELVAQLKDNPSQPVTLQIEEREGGELHFVASMYPPAEVTPAEASGGSTVVQIEPAA